MGGDKERRKERKEIDFSLEFHPEVEFDLQSGYDYYEKQRSGLGEEFLLSIEACINYLQRNPLHSPLVNSKTRRSLIKRFPYGVFYVLGTKQIFITAIVHLSRNPKIWKRRK